MRLWSRTFQLNVGPNVGRAGTIQVALPNKKLEAVEKAPESP